MMVIVVFGLKIEMSLVYLTESVNPSFFFFPSLPSIIEHASASVHSWLHCTVMAVIPAAGSAGERTIGMIVGAAQGDRNDMLQMKAIAADALGRLTVLAASAGALLYPRTQRAMTHCRPCQMATGPADGAAR